MFQDYEVTVLQIFIAFHILLNAILYLWFCMGVKLGSLSLREKHRLRLFEDRVLRRIFGPKRDEVTGG
jgi:hypothetical protein